MAADKISREKLNQVFSYMMRLLSSLECIIFYGTLLGYIRGGDFIDGDDDIDILLPFKQREKFMFIIKNANIPIIVEDLFFIQIMVKDIGPFDVYLYENRPSDILIRWDGNLLFSKNIIFPLKKVNYKGFNVFIPNNSEKVLSETYGENWKTPISKNEYDWKTITNVRFA